MTQFVLKRAVKNFLKQTRQIFLSNIGRDVLSIELRLGDKQVSVPLSALLLTIHIISLCTRNMSIMSPQMPTWSFCTEFICTSLNSPNTREVSSNTQEVSPRIIHLFETYNLSISNAIYSITQPLYTHIAHLSRESRKIWGLYLNKKYFWHINNSKGSAGAEPQAPNLYLSLISSSKFSTYLPIIRNRCS